MKKVFIRKGKKVRGWGGERAQQKGKSKTRN